MSEFAQPLVLAERLSPGTLLPAMQRNESRRTSTGLFHSAWTYIEYALNEAIDISTDTRLWHLSSAQALLGDVINSNTVQQDTTLGAIVLSSFIPVLKKRCFHEQITSSDADEVYKSIGSAMMYLRPLKIDEPPQWRMSETVTLALAARTRQPEFIMYPASPREEASAHQRLNHDSYFIINSSKLPLQQKLIPTTKQYDESITTIVLIPLIETIMQKHFDERCTSKAGALNAVISCIVAETLTGDLADNETAFLNDLSEAVVAYYRTASAKLAA